MNLSRLKHFARRPNKLIDMKGVRAEAVPLLAGRVAGLVRFNTRQRAPIAEMYVSLHYFTRNTITEILTGAYVWGSRTRGSSSGSCWTTNTPPRRRR